MEITERFHQELTVNFIHQNSPPFAASIARRRERGKRTNRGGIDSERKERAGMGKRKQEPIIVKAYVKTADGGEVDVDTLSDEQREKLGTWLRVTYLNELCRGKAKFHMKQ